MIVSWSSNLSGIIEETLTELSPVFAGNKIAIIAIDCQPWDGTLSLCVLTESECINDSALRDPSEMAAWRFFDCSDGIGSWSEAARLAKSMQSEYDLAHDRQSVVAKYLQNCARALGQQKVTVAIIRLDTSDQFRFSVTHPDDGTEYCGP